MHTEIQNILDKFTEEGNSPGVELSITHHQGEFYYQSGRVTENEWYDIASMTKCTLSTFVLSEVSQGNLSLDEDISQYVNYLSTPILLESLLNHTSGLDLINKYSKSRNYSHREIESIIKNTENISINATLCHYSNLNYIYLGDFLESRYSRSIQEIVENFLQEYELEMRYHTTAEADKENQKIVHDPLTRYLGGVSGAAGLFSTHTTLHRFGVLWLNNEFQISRKLYEEEFEYVSPGELYGRCWRKGRYNSNFIEFSGHTGPCIFLSKDLETIITMSCNICSGNSEPWKRENYISTKKQLLDDILANISENSL